MFAQKLVPLLTASVMLIAPAIAKADTVVQTNSSTMRVGGDGVTIIQSSGDGSGSRVIQTRRSTYNPWLWKKRSSYPIFKNSRVFRSAPIYKNRMNCQQRHSQQTDQSSGSQVYSSTTTTVCK